MNKNRNILVAAKGLCMGLAEIVPGVSGGTIAFITGIYERLLRSIKSFGPSLLEEYREGGVSDVWKKIDGTFLSYLLAGMLFGVVSGVFIMTFLLMNYPEPLWGFFFGLILSSSLFVGRQIRQWDTSTWLALVAGFLFAFFICQMSPVEGNTNSIYIMLSGMIAISALMLPGLSGSFILLIMGMYTIVVPSLKSLITQFDTESLRVAIFFGLGALIGLILFSRVISWLFKKYKTYTFAVLTGFMLGSLVKVWPWRNPKSVLIKDTLEIKSIENSNDWNSIVEEIKILSEKNVLPLEYWAGEDSRVIITILASLLGFFIVYFFERANVMD